LQYRKIRIKSALPTLMTKVDMTKSCVPLIRISVTGIDILEHKSALLKIFLKSIYCV